MIRYLRHSEINFSSWDNCIISSPNGLIYALSWYLNNVASEWDALVEDDYASVFPLIPRRKMGISYCIQPKWTQQLGLFSKSLITPEKSMEFISLATQRFRWFDMNMNSLMKVSSITGLEICENNNFLLNLILPYNQTFLSYSENLKRNLKKVNTGIHITHSSDHEEIISLFRANRGKNIKNLDDQSYKMFSRLIYQARKYNMAEIFALYDSTNTLTAGAVFLIAMGRAVMIFSAVSDSGRSINAMHRIIDHFIQQHSQQNLILDFEGSNDEQLARFYKSFGATNSPYLRIRHNKIPLPTSLIDVLRKA